MESPDTLPLTEDRIFISNPSKQKQCKSKWLSGVLFAFGAIFILLSMAEMRWIHDEPQVVVTHICYGSALILAGVAFLIGPLNYIKGLFRRDKICLTITSYIITTTLGVYGWYYGVSTWFALLVAG